MKDGLPLTDIEAMEDMVTSIDKDLLSQTLEKYTLCCPRPELIRHNENLWYYNLFDNFKYNRQETIQILHLHAMEAIVIYICYEVVYLYYRKTMNSVKKQRSHDQSLQYMQYSRRFAGYDRKQL